MLSHHLFASAMVNTGYVSRIISEHGVWGLVEDAFFLLDPLGETKLFQLVIFIPMLSACVWLIGDETEEFGKLKSIELAVILEGLVADTELHKTMALEGAGCQEEFDTRRETRYTVCKRDLAPRFDNVLTVCWVQSKRSSHGWRARRGAESLSPKSLRC